MKRLFTGSIILGIALSYLIAGPLFAQECASYYSFDKNAEFELSNYNAKDKLTGKIVYQILDVTESGGMTEATVRSTVYNEKNKAEEPIEFVVQCKDGTLYMDLKRFMNPEQAGSGDLKIKGESSYLEIPSTLTAGQTLPDGSFEADMTSSDGGKSVASILINVTNRKVEGAENLTTPAGSFDTYKISGDVEMGSKAMGFKLPSLKINTVEWYAKNVGIVRSESYRKGKLVSYSVLTRLQK